MGFGLCLVRDIIIFSAVSKREENIILPLRGRLSRFMKGFHKKSGLPAFFHTLAKGKYETLVIGSERSVDTEMETFSFRINLVAFHCMSK